MPLTLFEVGQSNTPFTFSFSILILFSPITTPKNPTSLTFHLHFSSFTYRLFSTNLFTTSSISLSCSFSSSTPTIILSMKLATSPVLIKFHRILFIIIQNIAGELVSLKNITVDSNNPSRVMNTTFHLSPFFIHTLLYPYCKFNLVNTFFIPIFSTISKIRGKG